MSNPIPDEYADLLVEYPKIMHLKIYIDSEEEELLKEYEKRVEEHNKKMITTPEYIDAGFDLLAPKKWQNPGPEREGTYKLDYKIKCKAQMVYKKEKTTEQKQSTYSTGFYLYPRSSISKIPLRLANSVGIIDASYRGSVMAILDCLSHPAPGYTIERFERLTQICSPDLAPIYVELVKSVEELGRTKRGEGGFGSTGR